MITFSCTNKVLKRLEKVRAVSTNKAADGRYNWYVDQLMLNRKKYFLFTHSQSLFSLVFYVGTLKELRKIEELFKARLKQKLVDEIGDIDGAYYNELMPAESTFIASKTNSRSVIGSMTDFKLQLKYLVDVAKERGKTVNEMVDISSFAMNRCPMSAIKYDSPKKRLKEILDSQVAD